MPFVPVPSYSRNFLTPLPPPLAPLCEVLRAVTKALQPLTLHFLPPPFYLNRLSALLSCDIDHLFTRYLSPVPSSEDLKHHSTHFSLPIYSLVPDPCRFGPLLWMVHIARPRLSVIRFWSGSKGVCVIHSTLVPGTSHLYICASPPRSRGSH